MPKISTLPMIDDQRWQAVQQHDPASDGVFVYAVRSTGIYCRPSCASRQPRRENVAFYASPAEAEAAGFRACKRCRPAQTLAPDERAALVEQARALLEQEGSLPLPELGRRLHSSPTHLQRLFKAATGLSPRQYAAALRLEQLKSELRKGSSVTRALYQAGYGSPSRLYERSAASLGMTPAAYRQGGKGMQIMYALLPGPLGRMLVAATSRGVCAVTFGDSDAALEAGLRAEYPAAKISGGVPGDPAASLVETPRRGVSTRPEQVIAMDKGVSTRPEQVPGMDEGVFTTADPAAAILAQAVAALQAYLLSGELAPGLPLDVQATPFQLRVWEELRRIPAGQTRSYAQVAQALGQPRAVRAVANACASNPTAVVTPCHRVVRSDGAPGGYRWGLERKRALLKVESRE